MNKTRIEWTDYTWNPIKGLCPVGCWYCYARKMYERFKWDPKVRLDPESFGSCQDFYTPNLTVYEKLEKIKFGSKIFICSTFELFHPQVPKVWKDAIFQATEENPHHTFQILTKMPENIDRSMPDNVWLGVSVTKSDEVGWNRLSHLKESTARIKFVSFEPILGLLNSSIILNSVDFDWFIFGRLTGYGKKYDFDKRGLICNINTLKIGYKKPVFLKDNLKDIWGEDLIQEFPE